jgi:hypothetical protein
MCHAAVNVALGHYNLNPGFEQSPRPLRRGAGESRPGASAASPVHEPRNRPAVIDVSIRGVLVIQIAISAGHESIGQPNRAPSNLLSTKPVRLQDQRHRWTQCRHHREL